MIQELFGVDGVVSACAVILFLVMVYAMNHLPKKKFSFAARVLMGAGCGTVFGLVVYALGAAGFGLTPSSVSGTAQWFSAASRIYLGLFRVLIGPVIFICTAHLVIHTPAFKVTPKEVKVKKQVNTFMVALSCGVGLVFGILFHVGSVDGGFGAVQAGGESLPQILLGLMPVNLAADLLLGKAAAVFIAGGLAGIAARRMSGKYMDTVKPFFDLTDAAFSIMGSVCKTVIAWKPAGATAIMAALTAVSGPEILWRIVKFLLVLTLAAAVMLVIQLLLSAACGVGPGAFFRAGGEAMVKALKTRSGSACLPEAQKALSEGLGLKKEITDEVSAYAISSGMQGCGALFPAMALAFTVHMAGGTFTPGMIVTALIVVTVVSYGITGAPGTATMAEFAAVMGTGMEGAVSGLGAMIAIDPIGDVPRTLINVTGCMTNAIIAERRLKE